MNREDIEKRAASRSMNKWIGVLENELDVEPDGSRPTERMKSAIEQLRSRLEDSQSADDIEVYVRDLVLKWYRIGARRGAAEVIRELCELKIVTEDDYGALPETIAWKKKLRYTGLDGERKKIRRQKYSIGVSP